MLCKVVFTPRCQEDYFTVRVSNDPSNSIKPTNIKKLFLFREFDDLQSPINLMMSGNLSSVRVFSHLENSIKPTTSGRSFLVYVFSDLRNCINPANIKS